MTHPGSRRPWSGLLALALFALGYLCLPVLDAATQHVAHGGRPDIAHVDDGRDAPGHRCVLPDAYAAGLPAPPCLGAALPMPVAMGPITPPPGRVAGAEYHPTRPRAPPHS